MDSSVIGNEKWVSTKTHPLRVVHLSLRSACNSMGHKGDPGVAPGTYGAIGERAQVILVWVRALGRWKRVTRVRPRALDGS